MWVFLDGSPYSFRNDCLQKSLWALEDIVCKNIHLYREAAKKGLLTPGPLKEENTKIHFYKVSQLYQLRVHFLMNDGRFVVLYWLTNVHLQFHDYMHTFTVYISYVVPEVHILSYFESIFEFVTRIEKCDSLFVSTINYFWLPRTKKPEQKITKNLKFGHSNENIKGIKNLCKNKFTAF